MILELTSIFDFKIHVAIEYCENNWNAPSEDRVTNKFCLFTVSLTGQHIPEAIN